MSDIIDINVEQTVEDVTINVVDNLITVNINKVNGGGGAVDSVNGQTGVVVLDQDDIADGVTYKQYSLTEKNKLAGIAEGAEVNVNADWNAVSGDAQILNKPTIPDVSTLVPYTGASQNVDLGEYELKSGQLTLDTTPTGTAAVATTRWNDAIGSSETTLKGGSVILKNGIDLVARVVNKVNPNTTLTKANYQVVRISGAQGQRLAVDLAQANNDNNSADTLGIVTETIATNQEGFIMTVGQLEGINTTGSLQSETWTDGDVLYLSPTTAGAITNIKPNGSTGHIVILGYVEYAHANNGKIYVKIMNGWELDELHNVFIFHTCSKQSNIILRNCNIFMEK
jgi:nitrogen fixation protein